MARELSSERSEPVQIPSPPQSHPSSKEIDEEEFSRRWEELHRCAAEQGSYFAFCLTGGLVQRSSVKYQQREHNKQQFTREKLPGAEYNEGCFDRVICPVCGSKVQLKYPSTLVSSCTCSHGPLLSHFRSRERLSWISHAPDIDGEVATKKLIAGGQHEIKPQVIRGPLSVQTRNVLMGMKWSSRLPKKVYWVYTHPWNQSCSGDVDYDKIKLTNCEEKWREPFKFLKESRDQQPIPWVRQGQGQGFLPYQQYIRLYSQSSTQEAEAEQQQKEDEDVGQEDYREWDLLGGDSPHPEEIQPIGQSQGSAQGSQQEVVSEDAEDGGGNKKGEEDGEELLKLVLSLPKSVQNVMFVAGNLGLRRESLILAAKKLKYLLEG
eukprot:TRINITY_DN39321_c0_g2_i3.p1 TRINITY_DN39321_c0_g2~~TRINITY_DN39321_c0_g2_i3.p1  ORF type:complete len:377 (-),score=66.78 TRINITY_DN39321_c0_g2_i3:235-1365(-)